MKSVDDRLSVRADIIDILVKIENPIERLLRRRDVVAPRAEDEDGRANVAGIDGRSIGTPNHTGRKLVADEELVDDLLHLFTIEHDMAAPIALEIEIAG